MPAVSVIIPCYNAEKYLVQCLNSVVNQSLRDLEIICVDDGSTDDTLSILRKYEKSDCRVRVLCQKNKYAGSARNLGMSVATGTYISFLDADDYYDLNGLENAYHIACNADLDVLKLSSYLLDDATGEITTNAHYSHLKFIQKGRIIEFKDAPQNLLNCADVAWNGLYRRSFLLENNLQFNGLRCVNDRSFYISCLAYAKRIMVTDEFLTYYRRNITGSLVSIRYKHFNCQIESYNLIKSIIYNADVSNWIKKVTLRYELNQIFIWYEKFLEQGINPYDVEEIITDFVINFDARDVGRDYLLSSKVSWLFNRFRQRAQIQYQTEADPNPPLISVIVPMHNSVRYLSEAIESVLEQSLQQFEIILIDDGSTDKTYELAKCFANNDRRIRLFYQEQSYAGVARNNSLKKATGEYVTFLDSDDRFSKTYLQDLYDCAVNASAQVVVSPRLGWNGSMHSYVMQNWVADKRIPQDKTFSLIDIPDYILNFADGAPGGKLFKKDFILSNNLSYLSLPRSEDFYFVFSSFVLADSIMYTNKGGYYYRRNNATSLEHTKDDTPLIFWDATIMLKNHLIELGVYDQIKRSYLNNTINRFAFNLTAVNTFDGFSAIFFKLKEIYLSELEMQEHEPLFFYDAGYNQIITLIESSDPANYLLGEYKRLSSCRNSNAEKELDALRNSISFKVGRCITYLPRKARGFICCMRDHGLSYTLKYSFIKLINFAKNKTN